jgi:hypothetical protein
MTDSSLQLTVWKLRYCAPYSSEQASTYQQLLPFLLQGPWALLNYEWKLPLTTSCGTNMDILEPFQPEALRMTVHAPWYVPNTVIRRDLQTATGKEEIRRYSSQYSARLSAHPNGLVVNLIELPDSRRLRRHLLNDIPTRFLV